MKTLLQQQYLSKDWIKNQPESFIEHALVDFNKEYEWRLDYIDYFWEPLVYSARDMMYYIYRNSELTKAWRFISENDLYRLSFDEFNNRFSGLWQSLQNQFSEKAMIENQLIMILSPEGTEKWFLSELKENDSYTEEQKNLILRALEICKIRHKWQYRDEWVEYFWHPIFTAIKWMQHWLWYEDIIALLLHDTIEDSGLSYEEIRQEFSKYTADKVMWLSKKINGKVIVTEEEYYENIDNDQKLATLKWLDRLANLFSLNFATPERKTNYLKESKEYILPIVLKHDLKLATELQKIIYHLENPLYELPEELKSKYNDVNEIKRIKENM